MIIDPRTKVQRRSFSLRSKRRNRTLSSLILLSLWGGMGTGGVFLAGAAEADSLTAGALGAMAGEVEQPMDEIVVYARKRVEKLQNIPASVAILSSHTIEEAGVSGLKDVADFTANFSYTEAFGRNNLQRPVIRGMSNILGAANAAIFIDGVYMPGGTASTSLFDLERVEILKGPGSALYGRATLAGAVNYITKRPAKEWQGQFLAEAASHDSYTLNGRITGPLIEDKLAVAVTLQHKEYGGKYNNSGPGGGAVGQEKSQNITGAITLQAAENFGAYLRVSYQEDRDGAPVHVLQPASENNCFAETTGYYCGAVQVPGEVALNLDIFENPGLTRDLFRTTLIMDWELEAVRLSSISSYNKDTLHDERDNDFLPLAALGGAFHVISDTEIKSASQEIRANSNDTGPLRWLVGGYYYHEQEEDQLAAPFGVRPSVSVSPVRKVNNYALFGSVEYDLSEEMTATVELRSNWDKISLNQENLVQSETFHSLTPRVAINYQATEEARLYLTLAKGTKPGGFNADLFSTAVPDTERERLKDYLTYDEEKAWTYEAGMKSQWLAGKLAVNLAAFYIDWTEQQLTSSMPIDGHRRPRPLIQNAGKTEIWGLEAEIQARPNDYLSASLSYGYSRGEFKVFEDEAHEKLTGEASVAGNKVPRSPEHSLNLSGRFTYPIQDEMAYFLRGDLSYKSSRFVQVHNLATIGATTKINIHTGLEWQDVRLTVFVKNLLDQDTPEDVTRYFDASSRFMPRAFLVTLPKGRQFGVRLNVDF